ncbi:uncharacterized protein LOC127811097 [Diospyros lotus]|uniref:uncharacterized protein LOC127811097 n=1 Tax=Diospyros lotus TaxID=55363 RepID=UPI00225C3F16|nr:uncharacterized protein LOC127811097 [Diospyros lotus]
MAEDLMNSSQHIERVIHSQTKEKCQKNRLRLRASVITVRLLALQGCAFRGHDESSSSLNCGNFIQMLKAFAQLSMEVDKVVLDNTLKNAQYIAPNIQKDILHIMANRVRKMIREDVGDREQLAIILRLQLALISIAKDVSVIWEFFSHLDNIINIINSSSQRISELQNAQRKEDKHMLSIGERESGSGANQIGNLQRAGATRWSSHYDYVKSMIGMYSVTCKVLEYLKVHCSKASSRAEVRGAYRHFACFEFVFNLILMHKIMRIIDVLYQALQKKSLDILAAMRFVSIAKLILQELREEGWEVFLQEVKDFCSRHNIHIPDLDSSYMIGRYSDETTVEHHYHFDVFNEAIDFVLMELSTRFNDKSIELISLSVALDPKNSFELFNSDDICTLAKKFYLKDFSSQDTYALEYELNYYVHDVIADQRFQVSTLVELCQELTNSGRLDTYIMITRLIRLVLTLLVSTATTEWAFSVMKLLKTTLRNKMEDDFLTDCMTLYIERELALTIDVDSVVDEFFVSKSRRAQV